MVVTAWIKFLLVNTINSGEGIVSPLSETMSGNSCEKIAGPQA